MLSEYKQIILGFVFEHCWVFALYTTPAFNICSVALPVIPELISSSMFYDLVPPLHFYDGRFVAECKFTCLTHSEAKQTQT